MRATGSQVPSRGAGRNEHLKCNSMAEICNPVDVTERRQDRGK